jgi:hypothetical protein
MGNGVTLPDRGLAEREEVAEMRQMLLRGQGDPAAIPPRCSVISSSLRRRNQNDAHSRPSASCMYQLIHWKSSMIRVLSNYYAAPAMDLSNREVHVATLVKRSQIGCHNEQQPTAAVIRRAKWQYGLNKHRRSPRTTDTKRILADFESDVVSY